MKQKSAIKEFFIKEKKKIFFSLIGLAITIGTIILYVEFDFDWLKWILCLSCMTYTTMQLYFIHFKGKTDRIVDDLLFSAIVMMAVVLLMYVILCIFSAILKIAISMKTLTIAVLISPSFIIVLLIILLFLSGLQYA